MTVLWFLSWKIKKKSWKSCGIFVLTNGVQNMLSGNERCFMYAFLMRVPRAPFRVPRGTLRGSQEHPLGLQGAPFWVPRGTLWGSMLRAPFGVPWLTLWSSLEIGKRSLRDHLPDLGFSRGPSADPCGSVSGSWALSLWFPRNPLCSQELLEVTIAVIWIKWPWKLHTIKYIFIVKWPDVNRAERSYQLTGKG